MLDNVAEEGFNVFSLGLEIPDANWEVVDLKDGPPPRQCHTCVAFDEKLIMYHLLITI
jgi:hypothetical protein